MPSEKRTGRFILWSIALLAVMYPAYAVLRERYPATVLPEDVERASSPPHLDGSHPCIAAIVTASQVVPKLDRCFTPLEAGEEQDRFEVDLRYGAFVLRQTDLHLNDLFDVPLTRSYVSQDWATSNGEHAFGHNTNHPYDMAPLGDRNPYTHMMLVLEDGDFLYFKRISAGTSFAGAVYLHTETSTRFYKSTIAWNGNGWTLKLADGSTMRFPEAYNSKTIAQGAAIERTNATGDKLLLHRDPQGNLKKLQTPHRHSIDLIHDEDGRITHAEDDSSHWSNYTYSDLGMLTHVVHSSGVERRYQYDGVLMTDVLDEHGETLVHNLYESGILVAQRYRSGEEFRFAYTFNKPKTFVEKVVVTLPDNTQRTLDLADSVPESIRNP